MIEGCTFESDGTYYVLASRIEISLPSKNKLIFNCLKQQQQKHKTDVAIKIQHTLSHALNKKHGFFVHNQLSSMGFIREKS